MFDWFKKHYVPVILAVVMILAFAIRYYHFNDWLYYKWDQGRDSLVIANAVQNGPGELPLMGPRAAKVTKTGDYLRLGPAYYYLQYTSAKLSGSIQPYVYAYPDLFFSIAVLPIVYLLCRLLFSKNISLILATLYAFSFIIIEYSRFAWNPNPVPFFAFLALYSLLKFVNLAEEDKHRKWWFILWIFCITFASQLHYFAFFTLFGISGLFLIVKYQWWKIKSLFSRTSKTDWKVFAKYLTIGVLVFAFVYTPVIISEVKTGGENTVNFFRAFGYKPKDKPLTDKLLINAKEQANNFYLILSSYKYTKKEEHKSLFSLTTGLIFILAGIILVIREMRKTDDPVKKDFLKLLLIWLAVFVVVCIPMAYQIRPRFFVVVFVIPYIFLGLWFKLFQEKLGSKSVALIAAVSVSILFLNLAGTKAWFNEQALSQKKKLDTRRTIILKRKDGVTLGQMQRAVDYMYQRSLDTKELAFLAKTEYYPPYSYLLSIKDPDLKFARLKEKNLKAQQHLFVIQPADKLPEETEKTSGQKIELLDSQQFGQMRVSEIRLNGATLKEEPASDTEEGDDSEETEIQDDKPDNRLYWKDVL